MRCDKTRGTLGRLSAAPADGSRGDAADGSRGVASRTRGRGLLLPPLLAHILKSQFPDIFTLESHYKVQFSEFVPPIAVVRVGAARPGGAGEFSLLCAGISRYRWCQDNTLLCAGISSAGMSVDQRRRLQSAHRRRGWHVIWHSIQLDPLVHGLGLRRQNSGVCGDIDLVYI